MSIFGTSLQVSENEQSKYADLSSMLTGIRQLNDEGITIAKLSEMNNSGTISSFSNGREFPDTRTINNNISTIMSIASNGEIPEEDKPIYEAIKKLSVKYNLANAEQAAYKITELISVADIMSTLANEVKNVANVQASTPSELVTYVVELVKNYNAIQQNSNDLFVNLNATVNENAILKNENAILKQKLAQFGVIV